MNWHISYSLNSLKFIKKNNLEEEIVINNVKLALQKFRGEDVNINIKKLSGKWGGFYRLRIGRLRIIVEFQFEQRQVHIEEIDWRGNAYK